MSVTAKSIVWYALLATAIGVCAFAAYRYGYPIIATLIVVIPGSLVINGLVAHAEDKAPGGFNDPDGNVPPKNDSKANPDA